MEKLTDSAQGYCEMYCKKYGHCFGDPGDCVFHDEVKMYESLKGYECTGMSPVDIKTMAITALREQEQKRWIPVKERVPENIGLYLVIENHWLDGSPGIKIAKWNAADWFTADRKSREITPRVTHWMPLPEPPKEIEHGYSD